MRRSEIKQSYGRLQENIRRLKTPGIEVWDNKYPDKKYTINLETPEFTCVCPKTGLPDFAAIRIEYSPAKLCVELKSFKEYLVFYRDVGIFHEHVVNKILEDFVKACRPRRASVTGEFNARGGIRTTVTARYKK
ncbi:MAG: NADPH-dependent 7-cyano-7-deazaguanine reductase QueF [Candidatus Omnitrophica bacterium]|nr:NADPH-dependent 7-cyano-7-deazaguanine reductase QueF [Candidatus Omnitrophota bacterium]